MEIIKEPTVELIALTKFEDSGQYPWQTDTDIDGQKLIEFAGRMCYLSWSNPAGRTNAEYISNMLNQGHLSVMEHATATFSIAGVSRSFTHELVRHRHLSFSQQSQRYVSEEFADVVEPSVIAEDSETHRIFVEACEQSQAAYAKLCDLLSEKFVDVDNKTLRRKMARQAARSVLPNAIETRIVVSGNFRAWRHFIKLRASEHAAVEIRSVAVKVLRHLLEAAPAVFADFEIIDLEDGTQAAKTEIPHG